MKTSSKHVPSECEYHLCKKKGVKLYKCKYCGKYFCAKHRKPRVSRLNPLSRPRGSDEESGGHPDWEYDRHREEEDKKSEKKYELALDRASKRPIERRETDPLFVPLYEDSPSQDYSSQGKDLSLVVSFFWTILDYGWLILMILVVGGTLYYWGFEGPQDERKEESIEALSYVNELRLSYGREPLEWDNRTYNLAVFRAKDLYTRNYFDHMTPDGLCVTDFKDHFGINEFGDIAENLAMSGYETGDFVGTVKEVVDGWMTSRGHRYALLYPDYEFAAIGCYKSYCAFLALTRDTSFLCSPATESTAFWRTANPQEYEV